MTRLLGVGFLIRLGQADIRCDLGDRYRRARVGMHIWH